MTNATRMKNATRISDLELYELVVAMYPEKFAARDEAGDDLWDEVMEFVEDDLVGELLCSEEGLRELLGRLVLLTMPMGSAITGKARHCLGAIEIRDGQAYMTAAVSRDVEIAVPAPEQAPGARAGLEWAIARCKALQSQGFPQTRLDVLIKDFEGCLSVQSEKTKAREPGLRWAIALCRHYISRGCTHSTHDDLIKHFEDGLPPQHVEGYEQAFPCWNCHLPVSMAARGDADGNCPHCSVELDLEDWPKKEA
ncbi:hypothetical protein 3S15_8 [uncultured Caudovirales phage]|uniref:Uncharacterized protein n=1 Tax=uncultured Caudovirales phage TaxID=2100421 RepID=A0A2H4JAD7_9CAUD|nr:hypothetical protein 3S15_8 [uncultured Caudovirales phage]